MDIWRDELIGIDRWARRYDKQLATTTDDGDLYLADGQLIYDGYKKKGAVFR